MYDQTVGNYQLPLENHKRLSKLNAIKKFIEHN